SPVRRSDRAAQAFGGCGELSARRFRAKFIRALKGRRVCFSSLFLWIFLSRSETLRGSAHVVAGQSHAFFRQARRFCDRSRSLADPLGGFSLEPRRRVHQVPRPTAAHHRVLSKFVCRSGFHAVFAPRRAAAPIAMSALTYTAAISSFVAANKLTTAANAIVLQYTAPIFVFLFSRL